MRWNWGFGDDDWRGSRRDGRRHESRRPAAVEELVDLALHGGLWFAGCLAITSCAPGVLAPLLLRELLYLAACAVAVVGLWRGENLTLEGFNHQDVALALLGLGMTAGLFVDPDAVEALAWGQAAVAAG